MVTNSARFCQWMFLSLGLISTIVDASGISAGVQSAWSTKDDGYVLTGGYMFQVSSRQYEYYEGGVVVLPGSRSEVMRNELAAYSRQYQNSAYGVYGGYFYYLMPIFRPGILIGTTIRDNVQYNSVDGSNYYLYSYSDFKLDYYIAFSIQVGLFAFTISNYGIGGGLCYMF